MRNGGFAFPMPHTVADANDSAFKCGHDGMTRRQWLAGLAMQSMVAGEGATMVAGRDGRFDGNNWKHVVAANAYEFADAMLNAEGDQFVGIVTFGSGVKYVRVSTSDDGENWIEHDPQEVNGEYELRLYRRNK